eukprot:TRINITY_DN2815_c0_g1_i1.p2 TRINITY_DN2815_c0_g1~~TRINITY_DN2815_c0_g1_i1.p2  ORF type:complete len:184 (-),score=43.36 TRINITY_DN2815_c0_g1_i1:91-642(-)
MLLVLALLATLSSISAYTIPCTKDGLPAGCDNTRFKPCGTYTGYPVILDFINYNCKNENPTNSASTSPFQLGNRYIVQFKAPTDQCKEILMQVGECWGAHPTNGGTYNCQGRCGPSCGSKTTCSNWAKDCLKHDVCSWYYGSSGGASDPACGGAFNQAQNDWITDCLFGNSCKITGDSTRCVI